MTLTEIAGPVGIAGVLIWWILGVQCIWDLTHGFGFTSTCFAALDTVWFPLAFPLALALAVAFFDFWRFRGTERGAGDDAFDLIATIVGFIELVRDVEKRIALL